MQLWLARIPSKLMTSIAMLLLVAGLALLLTAPTGIAIAQGEGQGYILDVGSQASSCCQLNVLWSNFPLPSGSLEFCDECNCGETFDTFSFPISFDPVAQIISGQLKGSKSKTISGQQMDEISIAGSIIDGWIVPHPGEGWEYGGTFRADATFTCGCACFDRPSNTWPMVIDTKTVRCEDQLVGDILPMGKGQTGGRYGLGVYTKAAGNSAVSLSLDCFECPLPAGIPVMPPSEELKVTVSVASQTTEEGAIAFAASVSGADPNQCTYVWDIDGGYMATTNEPTWAWEDATRGTFTIGVEVSDGTRKARASREC